MSNTLKHVAIIMDGNGRWAQARGLLRIEGHRAGVKSVKDVVRAAIEAGVPILTLYAFSQENWKRPKEEVATLMGLLDFFLNKEIKEMAKQGVCFRTIGRTGELPLGTQKKLSQAMEETKDNTKLILNVALNYGSRQEIVDAAQKILEDARKNPGQFSGEKKLSVEEFSHYLYTDGLPDPDFLIRTSGEMRLSNFLLWQLSYSEIYISKKYWPDFQGKDFVEAIEEFYNRERRFGNVTA